MIFYFSGTGNSLQAARSIAEQNGEALVSIAEAVNRGVGSHEFDLEVGETVGFVYPVYAWGPPGRVISFIEKLKLNNYKGNYTFSVATCGANIGNTMKVLAKALERKGMKLDSGFSLVMPNNYVIMGDVDSKEEEAKKLIEAEETLKHINSVVKERRKGVFELEKGFMPGLLTYVINPMFSRNAIDTGRFYAQDSCTSCGVCEKVCSCNNIRVQGKPQWGNECVQCLACLNYCPVKAVQYGKSTVNKGRYTNPNVKPEDIK